MMSLACEYRAVDHQQYFEKLSPFEIRKLLFELGKMNKVVHDEVRDLYYLL